MEFLLSFEPLVCVFVVYRLRLKFSDRRCVLMGFSNIGAEIITDRVLYYIYSITGPKTLF